FKEVRIAARNADKARAFIETLRNDADTNTKGLDFQHTTSVQEAISGADIVCTVTSASTPVLKGEWIEPGTHLNVAGSSTKEKKEIDTEAVLKGRIYIDYLPSTLNQAGEIIDAIDEGAFSADKIVGEIGQLLAGDIAGRSSADDITIYRSLGVLSQDLFVAQYLYEQATAKKFGTHVDF
ncbi:MAG: hypothetical protein JKY57_04315, partial [Kordiimonadaceae bacterium]|nr:hypothetical protein [Kordiimonadaceae bacterium]